MNWEKYLGVILACVFAPLAMSAPVIFSFAENRAFTEGYLQYSGSDGEHVVAVSAYASEGTPKIGSTAWGGLRIYNCTDDDIGCSMDDSAEGAVGTGYEIDGYGAQEAAILDFGGLVNLVSATFKYVSPNDEFALLIGGIGGAVAVENQSIGDSFYSTFNFGADVVGNRFAFLAQNTTDDFKLYSITADFVSNVPEPASLTLLGLGLLALGTFRRKKV